MKLFGLTGGIGMGKSTTAGFLARYGVPVVDTDAIARQLVEPGEPALAEIAVAFGAGLLDHDGNLRRQALAEIVFSSAEKLKQLEAILHPRIRKLWLKQVEEWRGANGNLGVVVIPLLYETDAQSYFDGVVCVACSPATQHERLRGRGWPEEQIRQRLAAQWPIEKKVAAAQYVIWTEGDMAVHERQIERTFNRYWDRAGCAK